jgi:hypothetical protein
MLPCKDELGEDITGKHRFDEPDSSTSGRLSKAYPRRETLDVEVAPESGRGEVLVLGLSFEAEPKSIFDPCEVAK